MLLLNVRVFASFGKVDGSREPRSLAGCVPRGTQKIVLCLLFSVDRARVSRA
jgi:hypothetical protein